MIAIYIFDTRIAYKTHKPLSSQKTRERYDGYWNYIMACILQLLR